MPKQFSCVTDNYLVCITYASICLLRFCRKKFSTLHSNTAFIVDLIGSTANILEGIGVSPTHSSKQHSSLLRGLLNAHSANQLQSAVPSPRASPPIADRPLQPQHATPAVSYAMAISEQDQAAANFTNLFDDILENSTFQPSNLLLPMPWGSGGGADLSADYWDSFLTMPALYAKLPLMYKICVC